MSERADVDINTHTTHRERSLGVDVDPGICLEVSMVTVVCVESRTCIS